MTPKSWFVLAAAGLGIYLLRKEAVATSAIIDKATAPQPMNGLGVVSSVPALQSRLVAGAQQIQRILDAPIVIPPPPPGISSWRAR